MAKEPTLAEIRIYAVTGKLPKSLQKQAQEKTEVSPEETVEETTEETTQETFPKHTGGGWWLLSNGKKVQNEDKAREMQAEIDGEEL